MKKNFKKNKMHLIGIDEVNYSPSLAGDCVICALYALRRVRGVKDSKQLTHKQRLNLFGKLHYHSIYSIVPATVNSINSVGIYKARNYAIATAFENLYLQLLGMNIKPEKAIIDGPFSKGWMNYFKSKIAIPVECMVNADEIIYQVSAASIVARIYADALFTGFGSFYPGYNIERNHGSPDKVMYEKIRKDGACPYMRVNYGQSWWKKIQEGKTK